MKLHIGGLMLVLFSLVLPMAAQDSECSFVGEAEIREITALVPFSTLGCFWLSGWRTLSIWISPLT